MPFSLYGDLPNPKTGKTEESKNSSSPTTGSTLSGLYASLPAPSGATTNAVPSSTQASASISSNTTAATTTTASTEAPAAPKSTSSSPVNTTPAAATGSKPAGWSGYGHFRPIVRKPTVQAKPKLHRPVIPAGATVVSTVSKNEYEQRKQEELKAKEASTDQHKSTLGSSLPPQLKVPFFTSTDDVNGFQAMQGSKKKGKGKWKKQQQQQQEPVPLDLNEDYDPHRPNDYEQYKEQRLQHREEMKKQQLEQQRGRRLSRSRSRSRSRSPSRSISRSRSRSPYSLADGPRSPSPQRHKNAFAPPPDLYQSSPRSPQEPSRRHSPSPASRSSTPGMHIDINESADDAYMRRVRMSQQRAGHGEPRFPQQPFMRSPQNITTNEEEEEEEKPMLGLGAGNQAYQAGRGLGAAAEPTVSLEDHMPSAPPAFVKSAQTTAATGKPMSSVVLLTNMVGPGEVDEDLQTETADECAKFGKVERCLIFEVPNGQVPDDQAVRIFVKFADTQSAANAVNDLNGRYFGGRVVTAKFYDNQRFDNIDLAPGPDESL
ncbi:hypothetical protein VTP01DRAFT_7445 [Rhizomucor pusillus]|uniref:uncharacterized protein n=1 Tax=Rhizomucor pusillus TaxID=4840 RepID=UPI00374312B9